MISWSLMILGFGTLLGASAAWAHSGSFEARLTSPNPSTGHSHAHCILHKHRHATTPCPHLYPGPPGARDQFHIGPECG
ncbi:MAG: hypothetical protein GWN88_04315, partial [Nitrospinaceae bacterium]|nr:hypothetical protein [Nitrospinaceae bacterium]